MFMDKSIHTINISVFHNLIYKVNSVIIKITGFGVFLWLLNSRSLHLYGRVKNRYDIHEKNKVVENCLTFMKNYKMKHCAIYSRSKQK